MDCTALKDLSPDSFRAKIVVRFARVWEFRSPDKTALYTIDFVVVDGQKSTMEGWIPGNRWDQFKDLIKEGSVYTVEKFDLAKPKKSYRSLDNPLRICFTWRTKVAEVVPPPENFPMFAYTALPLNMLSDRVDNIITLSDVVGMVNKVTTLLPPTGKAKSHRRQMYITDGSTHAIVTLWGEQADSLDVDELVAASAEEPIIILFVGMTVGEYSGSLALQSTSVTRCYVNAPLPEIADVRERTKDLPCRIDWHTGNKNDAEPIASSITEISTFEPNDIMIGQGTYSNVYRARDLEKQKIVALKKVRFDNLEPESVKFMAREILILRRLDHPNIIKLEGLVTSRMSCSLYLVFEYMEHDLAGLASFPGLKLTEPQVKCYMQQLLRGLEHCHSRHILHRDIKGSNLLIDNRGILKIADFGLASFFDPEQRHPLTSRVVTLWYRPPELLLGATNYGVAVDLWSTGCILAELYAGKPIMPGRTEVEQLHKIFKLCGSPSEDYWRKSRLPHATIFKPQHPYARRVTDTFKDFPSPARALVDVLLSVDPADRRTASSALQSEFFTTKPYACNPSSLPRYPPSKEYDAKRREEEGRRQGTAGGKQNPERRTRESRAVPAPDANAELVSSLQKRQAQDNTKSRSEMFNPCKEDSASGFPMEPPRSTHATESSENSKRVYPARTFHSGPLVNHPSKPGPSKNGELHVPGVADLPNFPVALSAGSNTRADGSNGTVVTQAEAFAHGRRLSESINGPFSSSGKYDQAFHQKNDKSSRVDGAIGYGSKGNKIHHSGPLTSCPPGNVDEMLKENDRQIQEVFRRTRVEKSRVRRTHGHAGEGHHQFGLRDFGAVPVFPSSRSSYRAAPQ